MIKKFLLSIFLFITLFSCGSSTPTGKVLNYRLPEEGKSLDPQLLTDHTGCNIHQLLSEGLTKLDMETKQPKPGLAEKYEVSSDGLTWTFHLRDNLKWSNGDKLTANDFKYAWLRALDPKTASEYAFILFPIKNAEKFNDGKCSKDEVGINVLDDKTLEVKLENVTPYFPSLTAFVTYLPANEKFVEEKGEKYALEPEDILSSGPFILKKWTHNSEMYLEKNPNYYAKDKISLDGIKIKFIMDNAAALNAFKNDEIDFTNISSEQYDEFKDDKRLKVLPQAQMYFLMYNFQNKVLTNLKIRKAFDLALNKDDINKSAFNSLNTVIYNFTPHKVGMPGNNTNDFGSEVGDIIEKYNADKAKELFKEGMKELGLTEFPKLSIIVNDMDNNKKVAENIQEQLRTNLGIEFDIQVMTYKERLSRQTSGDFDIALTRWGADYQDAMTFLDLFMTKNGNNNGKYSNPEYDKYVQLAKSEPDKAKRFEYLKKVEEIIANDVPITVLYQVNKYYVVNDRISNYAFSPVNSDMFAETVIK